MRILLASPIIVGVWRNYCPPLGLGYLKAVLKGSGITDVKVADLTTSSFEHYEKILREYRPDLVGITCFTETRGNALRMLRMAKELNNSTVTVMGGVHASLMYGQILQNFGYVDAVCLGEGEYTMANLVRGLTEGRGLAGTRNIAYLKDGEVVTTGGVQQIDRLDALPVPDLTDLDLRSYKGGYSFEKDKPRASVLTSRGCPFRCTYCASKQTFGKWRYRSPGKVVDEIAMYFSDGFRHFSFIDDLFTLKQDRIMSICQGIIDRKLEISWFAQTRADCVTSKEMLKLMKASGCRLLQFGVESGSERMLKFYNKKEKPEVFYKAFDLCREVGVDTQMMLIVGGDGESEETVAETKAFLERTRPKVLMVSNLRVFPKTALMERAKEAGLYNDDIWLTDKPFFYYTAHIPETTMNRYHRELMAHFARINGLKGLWWFLKTAISAFWKEPVKYSKIIMGRRFTTEVKGG